MKLLHRPIPLRWTTAALVMVALAMTNRVREVRAAHHDFAAAELLEIAHDAHAAGDYEGALSHAGAAVAQAPDDLEALTTAAEFAFVLGMREHAGSGIEHEAALELGMRYAGAAHTLDPENPVVQRLWAEGLLLCHLHGISVDRDEATAAWNSLPAATDAETAFRATALRLFDKPVRLAMN